MSARPGIACRDRVRVCVVAVALICSVVFPLTAPALARPATRPPADEATAAAAAAMLTRLDAARAANGLAPYRSSPLLAGVAAAHAREVAANNHFSHTGLDGRSAKQRMADAGYGAGHGGVRTSENFVARATVDEAFDWLMGDKDHRPNMLDARFREVGVGTAKTSFGFVWVLDFGTYDGVDAAAAALAPTAQPSAPAVVDAASTGITTITTTTTTTTVLTTALQLTTTQGVTHTVAPSSTTSLTTTAAVTAPSATFSPTGSFQPTTPAPSPRPTSAGRPGVVLLAVLGLLGLLGLAFAATRRDGARS